MNEQILCAAIYYDDSIKRVHLPKNLNTGICIGGYRHANCLTSFVAFLCPDWQTNLEHDKLRVSFNRYSIQGFLTSKGRFVDREEAMKIASESGQLLNKHNLKNELYSEDLY